LDGQDTYSNKRQYSVKSIEQRQGTPWPLDFATVFSIGRVQVDFLRLQRPLLVEFIDAAVESNHETYKAEDKNLLQSDTTLVDVHSYFLRRGRYARGDEDATRGLHNEREDICQDKEL
jgi:hypothetical protein